MPSSDGPWPLCENFVKIYFMLEDEHKVFVPSLLIFVGKTGFHTFKVTSLTILKLMVLWVMIFAIRMRLGSFWLS